MTAFTRPLTLGGALLGAALVGLFFFVGGRRQDAAKAESREKARRELVAFRQETHEQLDRTMAILAHAKRIGDEAMALNIENCRKLRAAGLHPPDAGCP
jgi:hypothetical protein